MAEMNAYEVLGVAPSTPINEIRLKYKRLMQSAHPDRAQHMTGAEFQRAIASVQEFGAAWRILRDPDKRAALDRELAGVIGHSVMTGDTLATASASADVDGVCSACKGEGFVRVFENRFAWIKKPCPKGCKVSK